MTLLRGIISFPAHVDCEALVDDEGVFSGPTSQILRRYHNFLPQKHSPASWVTTKQAAESEKPDYQLTVVVESSASHITW